MNSTTPNAIVKEVTLRFGRGDLSTGFDVSLRISEQGKTIVEEDGYLPPAPDLLQAYEKFRQTYRRHCFENYQWFRSLEIIDNEVTHFSIQDSSAQFVTELNDWLDQSHAFRPVRDQLISCLQRQDSIRFILRVLDSTLSWLPWHQTDLFGRYEKGAIALQLKPRSQRVPPNTKSEVRVLPILGDNTGINIQADLLLLEEKLPKDAKILEPLIATSIQTVSDSLWDTKPDILFFAGHSSSKEDKGVFKINEHDAIAISDLRSALKEAMAKGLRLVIFNSCDGLKLAEDLADLGLPAIIVMKERIPDAAAQRFLEYFLAAFTGNTDNDNDKDKDKDKKSPKPLTLAVLEAQKRLESLEREFACVSWLPTLFQQADIDLTWQDLQVDSGKKYESSPEKISKKPPSKKRYASIISAVLLMFFLAGFTSSKISSRLLRQGVICYKEGRYMCALKNFRLSLLFNPTNDDALNNLGEYYDVIDDDESAKKAYRRAITFGNPASCYNLSVIFINEEKYGQSAGLLSRCRNMAEEKFANSPAELNLANYKIDKNFGWIEFEQENYTRSKEFLRESLSYRADGGESHCILSKIQEIEGENFIESSQYCLKNSNPDYEEQVGWMREARKRLMNLENRIQNPEN